MTRGMGAHREVGAGGLRHEAAGAHGLQVAAEAVIVLCVVRQRLQLL